MKQMLLLLLLVGFNGYSQQTLNQSIIHDNLQRDYIIYIPSVYNVSDPIPLVFVFMDTEVMLTLYCHTQALILFQILPAL